MFSVPTRSLSTRLLAAGLTCAFVAVLVLGAIPVLFGSPRPMVRLYWRTIPDADRRAAEQQFHLSEPTHVTGNTWSYVPLDTSADTMRAIVAHPLVEDTDGINRRAFRIADRPPLTPRRGGRLTGVAPWAAGATRLSGYGLAGVAALLLLAGALTSPVLGPGSAFRQRTGGQLREAARALRAVPTAMRANARRSRSDTSAETRAVSGVFVATVAWRFLTFTGFTNDHYAHLALAQQMLLGDRPIRDFSDPGWPLTYVLTAIGWRVAGTAMATEWSITAAGFALGAAATMAVARRLSGSTAIALLVTTFEVLIFPRSYSYPKMLVYGVGAWILLGLAQHPSRRRIALAAGAVATAFLFRHDHGLFIGAASAAGLALASRTDGWGVALRRIGRLTALTVVLLLPWIAFVALNGGLIAYFEAGLDYSRGEAAATALTALPRLAWSSTGTANADAWLFWLFWSLPVISGIVAWRRWQGHVERWPGEIAAIGALIVVSILVNASFIRQALDVRLPDAIVPASLLGAWLLGVCWMDRWARPTRQWVVRSVSLACILASGIAVSQIGRLSDQYDNAAIRLGARGVMARATEVATLLRGSHREDTPSRYSVALRPFFAYLDRCSSRADRLIVTGEFPDIVVLAGRRFAGDGVVFGAWYSSSTHQDRTLERLRADPALFALHMGDYATFRERFSLIDRYLSQEYTPMAEIPVVEGGVIQIVALRGRPSVGIDRETGWSCFATTPTVARLDSGPQRR